MDPVVEYSRFVEKFELNSLELARFGGWVVSLRQHQATLGSLVVSLARPCLCFSDIDSEEAGDLLHVYRAVEGVLGAFVDYRKINYLTLMMVDSHLHFHVIPRYEGSRSFELVAFPDSGWPGLPLLGGESLEGISMAGLTAVLKKAFSMQRGRG